MTGRTTNSGVATVLGAVLLFVAACIHATPVFAEQFIDRMVAVVDGEVVTQGDIENFRFLGQFFGDSVPEEDDDVLNQLVEDMLIARFIRQSTRTPVEDVEIDAYLAQFGGSPELGPEVLEDAARGRIERARLFDSIRRSLRATSEELTARYEDEFVPELRARGVEVIPPLFEVEGELSDIVRADKLNAAVEARVEGLYRRYQVEVVD